MSLGIPPSLSVDSHCHFWRLRRGDYDWIQDGGESLSTIRRDFLPQDYPAERRVIAVQAAATEAETDFLLDLAKEPSIIAGVVGWVDLTAADAKPALEKRACNPAFKGVRPMLQDIRATEWLVTAPRQDVLDTLTSLGLRFDALITERHLPVLRHFAAQNPNLPIVIDHGAKPQPGDKSTWERGMAELARDPRIYCKLSGLLTELTVCERTKPYQSLQDVFERLLGWFGPDRLMWGSDWPVLTLAASYGDWIATTETFLETLSSSERQAIMGGNAARFYGLGDQERRPSLADAASYVRLENRRQRWTFICKVKSSW